MGPDANVSRLNFVKLTKCYNLIVDITVTDKENSVHPDATQHGEL